jgi:hypothetical protein
MLPDMSAILIWSFTMMPEGLTNQKNRLLRIICIVLPTILNLKPTAL